MGNHSTINFVFCNLSYATKKSHMQLFWSCMQHVQLHVTFFSCIRQVAKDKISSSVMIPFGIKKTTYLFFLNLQGFPLMMHPQIP
jgi:hypothetical protein